MTKYQEEFYKFVISPENFEAICDIVDNFPVVEEQLIYSFWVEVKARCEELLKNKKGWLIYLSPFDDPNPEFTIYRDEFCRKNTKDLCEFGFTINYIYSKGEYGLWINKDVTMFDREKIMKVAKDNRMSGWRFGTGFPYYRYLPEDLSEMSGLKKIHPENRPSLVQQYGNEIVDALNELEPFINKHILKRR